MAAVATKEVMMKPAARPVSTNPDRQEAVDEAKVLLTARKHLDQGLKANLTNHFLINPSGRKTSEQGQSRGFVGKNRDTDQGFAPKKRFEPRDSGPGKRDFDNDRQFRPRSDRNDQGFAPKKRFEPRDSGPVRRERDNNTLVTQS